MYLDTKNLTANSSSGSPAAATVPAKRMRKVWLPLRRLLTVGGKGRPAQLTLAHPNNVDLNNTQQQPQLELLLTEESKAAPEESTQKYGLELRQSPEEVEEDVCLTQPPNTPTLISSVYVEKFSARSCGACQHGRNCQHTHHSGSNSNFNSSNMNSSNINSSYINSSSINSSNINSSNSNSSNSNSSNITTSNINSSNITTSNSSNININTSNSSNILTSNTSPQQLPSSVWDLQLPLQYISTDNGTFFWANSQERVDDDLLHALLCQSFSQLPGTLC